MREYFDCTCDPIRSGKHYTGTDGTVYHAWLENGRMWKNEIVSIPQALLDEIAADEATKAAAIKAKTDRRDALKTKLVEGTITDSERDEILRLLLGV